MNRRCRTAAAAVMIAGATGCQWHGVNSLPLPGTAGNGPGSYEVQAQLPNVTNIQNNSRVRVGDVTVGHVNAIARQGWHALVTMRIDGDVVLPENATATVGQTSLLGSLHIELAPPTDVEPRGRLHDGSLIPLASGASYPSTEQTLAAISMLLNGGGLGQVQEITRALRTALSGREADARAFIDQLQQLLGHLDEQISDIVSATDSLNSLVGQFAAQQPVIDTALRTIPDALAELNAQRTNLTQALDLLGKFSALAADTVDRSKQSFVDILNDLWPVLKSLGDAGPSLTKSLGLLLTYPFPKDKIPKVFRGDYANGTFILDLTLSRIDSGLFTGTRFEGNLTELELQWGRTIGQKPSPYTAGNPLTVPYHQDGP
jgi:phospholipid/cholesterol/gamma-HCH transport system substrate-binding protein